MRDGSPQAVWALAETIVHCHDERAEAVMLEALRHLGPSHQSGIDTVCKIWVRSRHAGLATLLTEQGWAASAPANVKVLSGLQAGRLDVVTTGGAEVVEPLLQACKDTDPIIAGRVRTCLLGLRNADAIDVVCARWRKKRQALLAEVIPQAGYVAQHPPGVRVLSALQAGRIEVVTTGGAEVVEPLLQACEDTDQTIAERAWRALHQLENSGAQDALCRLVLTHDHSRAREIALVAQYAPRDPHQRALFYFLTEQWDKYEPLDFDQTLLRAAYEMGDTGLRRRVAQKARQAGRVEWVQVVTGERRGRRLEEMTAEDWEAALAVLVARARWEELWRLVEAAPPRWSAQILQRLNEAGWAPTGEEERAGFAELAWLVEAYVEQRPQLDALVRCRAKSGGHNSRVMCLAISPDGRVLASGGADWTVRLWRSSDGETLATLLGHTDWVQCLAVSPDGRVLASGSDDHTVRLWRLPNGEALTTLHGHTGWVRCLAISPDGQVLVSGSNDSTIRLWRLPDGEVLATLCGHTASVACLAISPDGRLLASGSGEWTVGLWRLEDGEPLTTLRGHEDEVTYLAFSPDGGVLASGGADRTVRLWRLEDGEILATLRGHTGSLAISPDGQVLASGSWGGTVGLWRLEDGEPLTTLRGHEDEVTYLAISPDGQVLASGSCDGTVGLWASDLARLSELPIGQTSRDDLTWVQAALQNKGVSDGERRWLRFFMALIRWQRRFDIEVKEAPRRIEVRQFDDIEIEG